MVKDFTSSRATQGRAGVGRRAPADYVAAHGAPHGADGAERRARRRRAARAATLRDDRAAAPTPTPRPPRTLAAAFVDDPFMALSHARGPGARAGRPRAAARLVMMEKTRADARDAPLNHAFVVDGARRIACACRAGRGRREERVMSTSRSARTSTRRGGCRPSSSGGSALRAARSAAASTCTSSSLRPTRRARAGARQRRHARALRVAAARRADLARDHDEQEPRAHEHRPGGRPDQVPVRRSVAGDPRPPRDAHGR